mgnify:CR=1 FL=1
MTNINADVLAINSVRGDEYFTLEKDVRIIADNLIPDLNIWCPFDTEESHFPHVLREYGHTVTVVKSFLSSPLDNTKQLVRGLLSSPISGIIKCIRFRKSMI